MDYHFNLRHGTQNKLRMPSVLQSPGYEKCFSTKSKFDVSKISVKKVNVKPVLNFLADLKPGEASHQKISSSEQCSITPPTMTSFSSPSSMSVSYVVGGFVRSDYNSGSRSSSNQKIPNIFDIIVSSFQSTEITNTMAKMHSDLPLDTTHHTNLPKCTVATMNCDKRTYADVAKGLLPKGVNEDAGLLPLKISNMKCELNLCSDSMVSFYTTSSSNRELNSICPSDSSENCKVVDTCKTCPSVALVNDINCSSDSSCLHRTDFSKIGDAVSYTSLSNYSPPEFSSVSITKTRRSLSECSLDSDDSFVVFQNEDEVVSDSESEDDGTNNDLDEFEDTNSVAPLSCFPSAPPVQKKTKSVSFKPDENLVEVHNMFTWDYAHRAARIGPWETYARDRVRFENRIYQVSLVLSPVLAKSHREAVFKERFQSVN